MKIILANPRGFCAGVSRAIDIVDKTLNNFHQTVFVHHEVVHNKQVVKNFQNQGVEFINKIEDVPNKSILIFSAHGVSKEIYQKAVNKNLQIFDATCPLVSKIHKEVIKFSELGYNCILVGHKGHPEIEGTLGQFNQSKGGNIYLVQNQEEAYSLEIENSNPIFCVTQTTLSVDDTKDILNVLKIRFNITAPKKDDICYATQNRQNAIKKLSAICDLILIVGSQNSSNSNRLKEIARNYGIDSYLINTKNNLNLEWIKNKKIIGISAGASAPEYLVQDLINFLKDNGAKDVQDLEALKEKVKFNLPKNLIKAINT